MKSSGIAHFYQSLVGALPWMPTAHARERRAASLRDAGPAVEAGRAGALALRPFVAVAIAVAALLALAYFRHAITVELRLAALYTLPVALAAWCAGRTAGGLVALLAVVSWFLGRSARHTALDEYLVVNGAVLLGSLVLVSEVVARVRAALLRSDLRFLRVLDNLSDAIYVTDHNGRVLYANDRLAALFGTAPVRTADDVAMRLVPVEAPASPLPANCRELRNRVDGRIFQQHTSVITWVDLSFVELHVLTNVTGRKVDEDRRAEDRIAARHAARLADMGETASILAHELSQPLGALVGYHSACIRLVESGKADPGELALALEKCRTQAVRARDIMHRMRELAQRRAPRMAPSDINAIVNEHVAATRPELARAGIDIELSLGDGVPLVDADAILVTQVIRNLVDNASEAMADCPRGSRHLTIATAPKDGGGIHLTVADRGHGVAPDAGDRIYRPFYTTRNSGLGLGLAICRTIAEVHGGRLWHESRAQGGTTFHFTLP